MNSASASARSTLGLIPQWVATEPLCFGWMDRLCEDYCGGIWNLYTLNNGGAFMAPEPDDDDDDENMGTVQCHER